jgi:serine/threonine protein phosphatase PrpC
LQDAWCVQERLGGQGMLLFGVFDGHGQEGKVVSHTICQNLPKIMARLVGSKVSTASQANWPCSACVSCRVCITVVRAASSLAVAEQHVAEQHDFEVQQTPA